MAITLEELPGVLKALRDRAATAAPPTVMAIADEYKDHLTRVTLRRSFVAPGTFGTPAPDTGPPAWRTGDLARSVRTAGPRVSGFSASASVAPHVVYARIQEVGGVNRPTRAHYMHWINSGGSWYKKRVKIPDRPYMQPALDETIEDGSLVRAAMEAFMAVVWG